MVTRDEVSMVGSLTAQEIDSLVLPGEFDEASLRAASEFDLFFGGDSDAGDLKARIFNYRDALQEHLLNSTFKGPLIRFGWPSSLFIPADADWMSYWVAAPPSENRYALDWAPASPPAGYSQASKDDGTLFCQQRIRTIDHYLKSEAGLGVLFTPTRTLSVVSLQPEVSCSGQHRWFAEFGTPGFAQVRVAGSTRVKASLILAAWHRIPGAGGFDLMHWKEFPVIEVGPDSGVGQQAISSYQRSFTGKQLATPLLVEKNHTYLLGVVARVSVWSTLTDDRGQPLPLIEDGTFRVWGSLSCLVPHIEVIEQQVHIP